MPRPLPLGLLACLVATGALGQGTPRSVGECERLKNDLAYNQCLAMFGPPAKNVAGGDGLPSAPPVATPTLNTGGATASADPASTATGSTIAGIPAVEEPVIETGRRGRRGRYTRRGGRQVASFTVGGDDAAESGSGRRRYRRHR
ncbi:hypothetical protein MMB17_17820 [Methylobacterium organophilum]|uniref:hypothetical protein n=1 Tax=Methylobacterium organophilum TaxID=410 RepID=UPI001F1462BD|nr:hypothetical protein [Methylobacterium organophilum]UMY16535.1 hypothetical protein MMB17_17820 [Methylobacterium organophilum]